MTPSPPTTFFTVTTTNTTTSSSSSLSSSSSGSTSTNTSSTSSSSSAPSSSATPPPFGPLAHARFGLGDLTDGLGGFLWGDLTSDTTPLASPVAGPTTATPRTAAPSSDAAVVPSTGKATGRNRSTQAAAASTATVSLSTATATTFTTTSISTPSASPFLSSPPLSTTGHEALIAYASSAPSTSASASAGNGNGTSESGGLRPGDLAGITIAAHVVLTVFIGLGLWHYRRKYRQLRDKERQRQRRRELASSTGYDDDDDKDMMASRKTASSSTILEMKRLRGGGGGGSRAVSKSSLSALELLEPVNSPAMMSGGGGRWRDHGGAVMPLTPDESPIIRPPSPLRLKGSDLRRKKPNLKQGNNDYHHAATATADAIQKNNHLFQGDDGDEYDDDASSSCYHYSDVADDRPASFGPARTPLLHLPNLSFHTLDLMADRPAFKEVKRYSVASPIRTPVPADEEEAIVGSWPAAATDGRRGSGRFPLVASVAGSVVGRKSDDEEEDGGQEDRDGLGGRAQDDDDAGAPARPKGQGQGQATMSGGSRPVKGGPRSPGGTKSPKSPPKILLYPKPYKGW